MRAIGLIIFSFSVVTTFAQTASDVERSYGKPVSVESARSFYSVGQHVWMTPEYAADGQVCRMHLYPSRSSRKTDYLNAPLLFPELVQVLNQIIPPHLRGSKKSGFGLTTLGGGTAWTTYEYENVSFNFISSYKLDPDILKKAEAAVLTGPDAEGLPLRKETPPSFDDFAASEMVPIKTVTISLNNRPCKVP